MNEVMQSLTSDAFDAFLLGKDLSIVFFWAPWCVPCRRMEGLLADLADEPNLAVRFYGVNADDQPALAERLHVETLPSVLLFRDGCLVERTVGNKTKQALQNLIQGLL